MAVLSSDSSPFFLTCCSTTGTDIAIRYYSKALFTHRAYWMHPALQSSMRKPAQDIKSVNRRNKDDPWLSFCFSHASPLNIKSRCLLYKPIYLSCHNTAAVHSTFMVVFCLFCFLPNIYWSLIKSQPFNHLLSRETGTSLMLDLGPTQICSTVSFPFYGLCAYCWWW